jgi:tRNA (guanine37-N1)-methyltransferase
MIEEFLPPVNRAMRILDRSFFRKTVALTAARIRNKQRIADVRKELERSHDALKNLRMQTVLADPSAEVSKAGGKCLLLKPAVKHDGLIKQLI